MEDPHHQREKRQVRNAIHMARMAPRFKDHEELLRLREETHWRKTTKLLQSMGIIKKPRFDRLLLEELGLVGMVDEGDESDN